MKFEENILQINFRENFHLEEVELIALLKMGIFRWLGIQMSVEVN